MAPNTDNHGVPYLSADDIELKAEEVISYFDKEILARPQRVPLLGFVETLHDKFGLARDYKLDLGETQSGNKIQGKTTLKPLGLFVDVSLVDDDRFPFVLGHELGHVILHRFVDLKRTGYADQELVDSGRDFVTGKKNLQAPRDWLEWQANRFSAAILMPRATTRQAVENIQMQMEIRRNLGHIVLENKQYSIRDYTTVRNELGRIYGVNATNVECRLKELDILIDRRNLDVKHISELFSTD